MSATMLLSDELLRGAAQQLARETARMLPAEEEVVFSTGFEKKMSVLLRQMKRRRVVRTLLQRAAAVVLTAVFALGVVLAVSPVAQAAARQWFMKVTDLVTFYWFAPAEREQALWNGLPQWLPEDCELVFDLQGSNGIRTLRYASPDGDILLQRITLHGNEYTVELRSRATDGLSDAETGQRPQGEAGAPEGYAVTDTKVGGHTAQRYDFRTADKDYGDGSGDFGIRCYADGAWEHHVALAQGVSALIWMDEAAQELFILVGSDGDMLQKIAESIY